MVRQNASVSSENKTSSDLNNNSLRLSNSHFVNNTKARLMKTQDIRKCEQKLTNLNKNIKFKEEELVSFKQLY